MNVLKEFWQHILVIWAAHHASMQAWPYWCVFTATLTMVVGFFVNNVHGAILHGAKWLFHAVAGR